MIRKVDVDPDLVRNIKSGIDTGGGCYFKPMYVYPDGSTHAHGKDNEPPEGSKLYGYLWWHEKANGDWCNGVVSAGRHQIVSQDPLHFEPSLLCNDETCRKHGYVRGGVWQEV